MNVQLLHPDAYAPSRATEGSAGYDIQSIEGGYIPPMGRLLVRTGIAVEVPAGTYGRVAPRSGLSVRHGIHVGAGVIDRDYRGEIKVLLVNLGYEEFRFNKGDRIAQLILEKIHTPIVIVRDELSNTNRGDGGFGSTGL
jgi:dUTP pyrophosphatase